MNNPTRIKFNLELESVKLNCVGAVLPREANQAPDVEQVLLALDNCYLEYPDGSSYFAQEVALIPFVVDYQLHKTPIGYIAFVTKGAYEALP